MDCKEKISIIVPVYKVEKEINRCVDSLINQTYSNIEIVLVDDESPDRSPDICDDYAKIESRVIVIHKPNGGLSDARNAGLKKATGEYILYVDSDDYLEVDACEKLLAAIQKSNADFVVGVLREVRKDSVLFQLHSNIEPMIEYSSKDFIMKSIEANEWYAPAVLNLYRRKFLLENDLFYKVGYVYEDMEMLPRLFLSANKIIYLDYPFYNYIIRDDSIMTSGINPHKQKCAIENYDAWKKLCDSVEDGELRKTLYGIMIRYYLKTCRTLKITGWNVHSMGFKFSLRYALNLTEKIKVCIFQLFPGIYTR